MCCFEIVRPWLQNPSNLDGLYEENSEFRPWIEQHDTYLIHVFKALQCTYPDISVEEIRSANNALIVSLWDNEELRVLRSMVNPTIMHTSLTSYYGDLDHVLAKQVLSCFPYELTIYDGPRSTFHRSKVYLDSWFSTPVPE